MNRWTKKRQCIHAILILIIVSLATIETVREHAHFARKRETFPPLVLEDRHSSTLQSFRVGKTSEHKHTFTGNQAAQNPTPSTVADAVRQDPVSPSLPFDRFRSGGLAYDYDFRWSSLSRSSCARRDSSSVMHVAYAMQEYSSEAKVQQLERLVTSLHSLFHIGCGTTECKRHVQVHIFFQGFDITSLERATGYLILKGLQIVFYSTTFDDHVVRHREVWGYGEGIDQTLQKLKVAANYFRFYLASLLKGMYDAEAFLYLDTDTVFVGNGLDDLFVAPLPVASFGQQELTSCTLGKMLLLDDMRIKHLGFKPRDPCLAASVMLVNTTLWIDQNVTKDIEVLIESNAKSKLWHLGSMPPLMIALHGQWRSLGEKIQDGKGSDCSWLDIHTEKTIIHPFKAPCNMTGNMLPEICLHANNSSLGLGIEPNIITHMRAFAQLVEGQLLTNPDSLASCDVIVSAPESSPSTTSYEQKVTRFKPNNADDDKDPSEFITVDKEDMEETSRVRAKTTVWLQLGKGSTSDFLQKPRKFELSSAEPTNLRSSSRRQAGMLLDQLSCHA